MRNKESGGAMSREVEVLAPCPFCGEEPVVLEHGGMKDGTEIKCRCGARVEQYFHRDAVAAWNRRATGSGAGRATALERIAAAGKRLWVLKNGPRDESYQSAKMYAWNDLRLGLQALAYAEADADLGTAPAPAPPPEGGRDG